MPSSPAKDASQSNAKLVRHFPALDGLRGAAVIAVFVYHYGAGGTSHNLFLHGLGVFVKVGWAGVTLFFLLSGFLITGILWDSKGESHWWRNFYVRRALRIFPLYYGSLLLVLLFSALRGEFGSAVRLIWIPALYLQNFPHLAELQTGIHGLTLYHYWSLAVEEQFYLLWPPLLFLMSGRKQAARLCLVVFGLSLLFRIGMCVGNPVWMNYDDTLPARAGELALGGWLAITYRGPSWESLQRALPYAAILSAATVFFVAWRDRGFEFYGPLQLTLGLLAITIFLAAVLARSLKPGILQRMFSADWLRWVGRISFGIYIFHALFLNLYTAITLRLVPVSRGMMFNGIRWLIAAACTVALAWLSFNFMEQPFLRLKVRFAAHRGRN